MDQGGAILAAVIGLTVFIYFFLKNNKSTWILVFVFLFAVFMFFNYFSEIFELIIGRFESQGLTDDGRLEIIKGSLDAFSQTFLFGVGAGSLMPILYYVYNFDIAAAHNLFLEVGIQYGLITFVLFMYFFIKLYKQQKLSNDIYVKNIIIGSLCMAPLTFTIDSGYILNPAVWLFLSSLYVIANPEVNSKEHLL